MQAGKPCSRAPPVQSSGRWTELNQTNTARSRMATPALLFPSSPPFLSPARSHPFTRTAGSPRGSRASFPLQKASARALSSLSSCPGHVQRRMRPCSWRISCTLSGTQLRFLSETPDATRGSSFPSRSRMTSRELSSQVKGPPFPLIANIRQVKYL